MDTPFDVPDAPKGDTTPPKYIRTFSGDMETLEKGGTPDLAPLKESNSTPLERIVAPSPISETPTAAPGEVVLPDVSAEEPVYTPPPPERAPIETYGADFVDRVRDTNASTASMLAAEQDSAPRAEVAPAEEGESRSNKLLIAGGIVLLLVGAGGAYAAYSWYAASHAPVLTQAPVPAPIFVDDREEVSGSGPALAAAIAKSVARPITSGSVRLLYASSTQSVFNLLSTSAPGILSRNVNGEGSMAGVVSVGGVQSAFFILSVSSYSDTFAGMLSFETVMPRALGALYPAYPSAYSASTATSSPSTATSTATTTVPAPVTPSAPNAFHDEVVSNHDVRVYRDASGKSVLMYGYWNQTTLIIARDPAAFAEIAGRLATSRSH